MTDALLSRTRPGEAGFAVGKADKKLRAGAGLNTLVRVALNKVSR